MLFEIAIAVSTIAIAASALLRLFGRNIDLAV